MEDTTQRLQEAIKAAREGRLVEARGIAEELTEADPQNAHAWYLRGILAEDEGQQLEYLNKALEIDPEHQPARKRMEQMRPQVEEPEEPQVEEVEEVEEIVEVEEVEEAEEIESDDMTMVADSATFMAAVASEGVEEETLEGFFEQPVAEEFDEDAAEENWDDTMIAESPFAEEMAAEDIQVEDLFADDVLDEDEQAVEEEDLATVIAAAAFLGEDEDAGEQEEPEVAGLQASDLAAAAAGTTVLDEAGEAWFEEEAGDELWAKVEAEAVPDWLIEDTSNEVDETLAGESLSDTYPAGDTQPTQEQDLPDWLLDEPDEDWTEADEVVEETGAFDEAPATVVTAAVMADKPAEDEEEPAPVEEDKEEPAPAKPKKKKSADRGIEIALILLIIVAVVIVGALLFFLINPPF